MRSSHGTTAASLTYEVDADVYSKLLCARELGVEGSGLVLQFRVQVSFLGPNAFRTSTSLIRPQGHPRISHTVNLEP